MKQYEYKLTSIDKVEGSAENRINIEKKLNELGDQGWKAIKIEFLWKSIDLILIKEFSDVL